MLAFTGTTALAQTAPGSVQGDDLTALNKSLSNENTTSQGGRLLPAARVIASTDDTTGQITFSTHDESGTSPSTTDYAITISAPFSKKKQRADFLTVDGLPDQWSVGFTFSHSFLNFESIEQLPATRSRLIVKAGERCKVAPANRALSVAALDTKCDLMQSEASDYLDENDQRTLQAAESGIYAQLENRSFVLLNVNGTVGTQEYEYFDPATLAKQSQRKVSYEGGVWLGVLPKLKSRWFLVAGFDFKRNYNDADEATYCPASTGPAPVKCTAGAFGPPEAEIDTKLEGKIRYKFSDSIGLEVSAAYDFHDQSWGVEAPLYLISDKDNGLVGGLRTAYDSKKDDFQFGIFVGKTFDFLKIG